MSILKFMSKLFKEDIVSSLTEKVEESIESLHNRISAVVTIVLKSLILFFMALLGGILMLVGLSVWLQNTLNLNEGIGLIIVGGGLLVLSIIVKLLKWQIQ